MADTQINKLSLVYPHGDVNNTHEATLDRCVASTWLCVLSFAYKFQVVDPVTLLRHLERMPRDGFSLVSRGKVLARLKSLKVLHSHARKRVRHQVSAVTSNVFSSEPLLPKIPESWISISTPSREPVIRGHSVHHRGETSEWGRRGMSSALALYYL